MNDQQPDAPLTMRQLQSLVDRQVGGNYWHPLANLARLTEEVGETARLVNHLYGPKAKKSSEQEQDLGLELADIIFTVVAIANSQHINLDASIRRTLEKYQVRGDQKRFAARRVEEDCI